MEPDLSLAAELLLLSVDPARGGLLPRKRRRFRRALAAARRLDSGGTPRRRPWHGLVARRCAVQELSQAGLIERRGRLLQLRDRAPAAARFNRLRHCLAANEFAEPRDRHLAVLLAWAGVLRARLSSDERRIAARRLRELVRDELAGVWRAPLSGNVADEAHSLALLDALGGLDSGDLGGLDLGGQDWAGGSGGESWGGSGGDGGDAR